jgi:hypothetical protein
MGWGQQGGKNALLFDELQKIIIPDPFVVVFLELFLALGFKETDGFFHHRSGLRIQVVEWFRFRIEQHE